MSNLHLETRWVYSMWTPEVFSQRLILNCILVHTHLRGSFPGLQSTFFNFFLFQLSGGQMMNSYNQPFLEGPVLRRILPWWWGGERAKRASVQVSECKVKWRDLQRCHLESVGANVYLKKKKINSLSAETTRHKNWCPSPVSPPPPLPPYHAQSKH